MTRLVDAVVDVPAEVLDESTEQSAVNAPRDEVRVDGQMRYRHSLLLWLLKYNVGIQRCKFSLRSIAFSTEGRTTAVPEAQFKEETAMTETNRMKKLLYSQRLAP